MIYRIQVALFLPLLLCHTIGYGWWDKGHMIVANIAEERLHDDVRKEVDHLIGSIGVSCPDSASFVESACWLDDIRNRGMTIGWTWHGSARPYDPQEVLSIDEKKNIVAALLWKDGVYAIKQCREILSSKTAGEWEKAFMLRVLIHTVGDIHCPMHCVTKYSREFPAGDRSGGRFPLVLPPSFPKQTLHCLWDSILLLDTSREERPLEEKAICDIKSMCAMITGMFPEESVFDEGDCDIERWAQESYDAGVEAYNGIEPYDEPTEAYLERSRKVACKRLALAGYRLAEILNSCLGGV